MPGDLADTKPAGDPRRQLPSVSGLLDHKPVASLLALYPRPLLLDAIREVLDSYRATLHSDDTAPSIEDVSHKVGLRLGQMDLARLRPVVNATGVVLHTGLGRAVLPTCAAEALAHMDRYCNLQIDLDTGLRGKRNFMTESLLCRLTGAEAALVVNNNAAATLLVLKALCHGREVIVSRGQLIEIGGSFRLPDCIQQSGARLAEVGTTNKTHLRDYKRALSEATAAILHVNPSNYRVIGFSKSVPVGDLVTLKTVRDVLVIDDLGCGALIDLDQFGLPHEPTVQESLAAGVDLALFSGDKLIGGPQSGIIVGKRHLVERIRKHPLTRMLRIDKMTDLALDQTLRLFLEPKRLPEANPTLRMLCVPLPTLREQANRLADGIRATSPSWNVAVVKGESVLGGGALPATPLPTFCVAVSCGRCGADRLGAQLRRQDPPIIGRVRDNAVLLDVRTLLAGEIETIIDGFSCIAAQRGG